MQSTYPMSSEHCTEVLVIIFKRFKFSSTIVLYACSFLVMYVAVAERQGQPVVHLDHIKVISTNFLFMVIIKEPNVRVLYLLLR